MGYPHTGMIAAVDLFVVPTNGVKLLCGLVILRLERRRLIWTDLTANPTDWTEMDQPSADSLVGDDDPALSEKVLDIPEAECKSQIQTTARWTSYCGGHLTIGARISSACRFTHLEPLIQMAHALASQKSPEMEHDDSTGPVRTINSRLSHAKHSSSRQEDTSRPHHRSHHPEGIGPLRRYSPRQRAKLSFR